MATTSIWSVKGWLGKLVIYVENPNKTTNPQYYEKAELTEKQAQTLLDVIDYAADPSKTDSAIMSDKKLDNLYAALMLIEILLEKGLINQATYTNIVKNAKSHI